MTRSLSFFPRRRANVGGLIVASVLSLSGLPASADGGPSHDATCTYYAGASFADRHAHRMTHMVRLHQDCLKMRRVLDMDNAGPALRAAARTYLAALEDARQALVAEAMTAWHNHRSGTRAGGPSLRPQEKASIVETASLDRARAIWFNTLTDQPVEIQAVLR